MKLYIIKYFKFIKKSHNDANTINELFLTQLDFFQNTKLINTFNLIANNTFKYQIIFIDIPIFFINPISYSFTTSINLQYNESKFKKLLIGLIVAIRSKGHLGQLKAL